jgi:hypothetical protein
MAAAGEAVPAMTANDMALSRDELAFLKITHRAADLLDHTDKFMSDHHRHGNRLLSPRVPIIDMDVGPADGAFLDTNQDIVRPDLGDGDFLKAKARFGIPFDQSLHRLAHAVQAR